MPFFELIFIFFLSASISQAGLVDTYQEDFDSRKDGVSINGIDSWEVTQGAAGQAVTQSDETIAGTGKTLKLAGDKTTVKLNRKAGYGGLTPTWIEYKVKPGVGAQRQSVPDSGIAAITFDYSGKIYAADGAKWVETGETFKSGEWYKVTLKIDFSRHLYDLYVSAVAVPKTEFIPLKTDLGFIDASVNSLSNLEFDGVYSSGRSDDSFIDDLVVNFVDRLQVITPGQSIVEDEPSQLIIVQLQNYLSAPQTAWEDIILELKSTSPRGVFSLSRDKWQTINSVIMPQNSQAVSFYYKDGQSGKPIITAKEYPDRGWKAASQELVIVKEAAYFDVAITSPQVAGESFTIAIAAKDDQGQVNEAYSGEIEILAEYVSPDSGRRKISPENASGFTRGKMTLNAVYPDCGIISVAVRDKAETSKMGRSGAILFIPDSFALAVTTRQAVGREFPLEVSAFNKQGVVAPNYRGPVRLSSVAISPDKVSGGSILPSSVAVECFKEGKGRVNISYNRCGKIKIKAEDSAYPSKTGLSGEIDFYPAGLRAEVTPPPGGRDFFYQGETINISVSAIDGEGRSIPNYQGLVDISASMSLGLSASYEFKREDEGKHIFAASVKSAGVYEAIFEDKVPPIMARTPPLKVKEAILEVVSTYALVGTAEVTIKLVDEMGQIIKSENSLPVKIKLEEEVKDGSAFSEATQKSVTFVDGIARILVSDTQPEIVAISPFSDLEFKVKKGTVTFGRITRTGIGTLMWREIKE